MNKTKPIQKLNIQTIPISEIKRAAYNPRREFTEEEQKSFDAELDRFSCVELLVWNENTGNLVGGHKRLDWLEKRGATEVEVSVVNLSEEEEKILNLALNRQGQGVWDEDKLTLLLNELSPEDLTLTGFPAYGVLEPLELEPEPPNIQHEDIRAFKRVHVLLSCSPDVYVEIEPALKKLIAGKEVEYEYGAN